MDSTYAYTEEQTDKWAKADPERRAVWLFEAQTSHGAPYLVRVGTIERLAMRGEPDRIRIQKMEQGDQANIGMTAEIHGSLSAMRVLAQELARICGVEPIPTGKPLEDEHALATSESLISWGRELVTAILWNDVVAVEKLIGRFSQANGVPGLVDRIWEETTTSTGERTPYVVNKGRIQVRVTPMAERITKRALMNAAAE